MCQEGQNHDDQLFEGMTEVLGNQHGECGKADRAKAVAESKAMDAAIARVLEAPDCRTSKRAMLGLDKGKSKTKPEPSLFEDQGKLWG